MESVFLLQNFKGMRSSTENIYQQKVNQVIDYISLHLHEPLLLDVIAAQANVSQRQLLRIMRSSLDEPLSAYVARQRMEHAVMYMQTEEMSLATLAGMVGYDNPQSFSKAFKKQFGISPKAYLDELQSRLEHFVENTVGKHSNLHPEIVEEGDIELVYIRIFGKYGEEEPYEVAWNKLLNFLKQNNALSGDTRFIGISFDDPNITGHSQCRFYACASTGKKIVPTRELGAIRIQKGRFAVYTLKGSYSGLQELYNNICVNLEHTLRYGVAFEEYLNSPHDTKEEDLLTKIYIPVK
ncbi:AraC family transcriptional regulator [Bacteroidia bacterium]|nr:AraC family transcriptional regulator [Bacteroidia bacterium]